MKHGYSVALVMVCGPMQVTESSKLHLVHGTIPTLCEVLLQSCYLERDTEGQGRSYGTRRFHSVQEVSVHSHRFPVQEDFMENP